MVVLENTNCVVCLSKEKISNYFQYSLNYWWVYALAIFSPLSLPSINQEPLIKCSMLKCIFRSTLWFFSSTMSPLRRYKCLVWFAMFDFLYIYIKWLRGLHFLRIDLRLVLCFFLCLTLSVRATVSMPSSFVRSVTSARPVSASGVTRMSSTPSVKPRYRCRKAVNSRARQVSKRPLVSQPYTSYTACTKPCSVAP